MRKTDFTTIPRLSSNRSAAFFAANYPVKGIPIDALPEAGLVEIRCCDPNCSTAIRASSPEAARILEKVQTDGCPHCNKKAFSLFLIQ